MLINREDPRFWDVRTRDRRMRRGDLTSADVTAHLSSLPDAADKGTTSMPLEEPDERRLHRLQSQARIVAQPNPDALLADDEDMLDDLDDLDDLDEDEEEDDDDDEDFPLKG